MTMMTLGIDPAGLAKLDAQLTKLRADIPKAIAMGLNDGGQKVRTQVQRALKQQTNVRVPSSISKRIQTIKAGPGSLSFSIVATGKGIPISEFPVKRTLRGVDAQTWGVDHMFARSFGLPGTTGPAGFRARIADARYPIRKLYGPALPKEIVKGETALTFIRSAGEIVPAAVLRQLARIL